MNAKRPSLHRLAALACAALAAAALAYCDSAREGSTLDPNGSAGSSGGASNAAPDAQASALDAAVEPPASASDGGPGAECARDEDCVPSACCHPTACVPVARRPVCEGVMCTMNCQPGTLDCGGGCVCQSGRCAGRVAR